MYKKIILLNFLAFSLSFSFAQTGLYKTYEDYKKGNLEKMDEIKQWVTANMNVSYVNFISPDGSIVKYKPKDYWGFVYQGNLFRSRGNHDYACLKDSGKIFYYENGHAWIGIIKHDTKNGTAPRLGNDSYAYVSKDIASDIYAFPASIMEKGPYKKFKSEYPEYEDLYDCLGGKALVGTIDEIRECIKNLNHSSKSKK
jgi:hypothetical protein